jgi:hypothetical protein
MVSKQAYLTDDGNHDQAHLMFYVPHMGAANWGANVANSPVSMDEQPQGNPPMDVLVVPVGKWSDGTSAPLMCERAEFVAREIAMCRRCGDQKEDFDDQNRGSPSTPASLGHNVMHYESEVRHF